MKKQDRGVVELRMVGVGVGQFWHRLATFSKLDESLCRGLDTYIISAVKASGHEIHAINQAKQ